MELVEGIVAVKDGKVIASHAKSVKKLLSGMQDKDEGAAIFKVRRLGHAEVVTSKTKIKLLRAKKQLKTTAKAAKREKRMAKLAAKRAAKKVKKNKNAGK